MKIFAISLISSFLTLVIIDSIWLNIAKTFYTKHIGHLMAETVHFLPAAVFYIIYAAVISILIIIPTMNDGGSLGKAFVYGALLGLAAYAAYDLTNHATLKDWRLTMTIVDMAWGTLLTGSVSAIAVFITKYFAS